jgi:Rps23 Pro-64 3,4-dihydroxylase Tpa1-like proline 4-hydroxylase
VLNLLNPQVQGRAEALRREFQEARPFRYVAVDDFLEAKFCASLQADFPRFDEHRARNEMGETGRKATVPELTGIGPAYRQFDQLMKSPAFLSFMGDVASIPNLLYDPDYVGGGTHENLDGQDLDMHVDFNYHPKRRWHRRLNLIVFLNPQWQESWGGCLELLKDPWNPEQTESAKVVPVLNRAVLFETTETSWHGFTQIQLPPGKQEISRRSLAVYFYSKERPAAETGARHGTLYIPRPLPSRFEAGYRLEPEDASQLRDLITRRDDQIRFLYEREVEFTELIDGLTHSPSFQLGRFLTWPLRKLRGSR